ncbi:hypothetical protein D3C76_1409070 [compost metagenome]
MRPDSSSSLGMPEKKVRIRIRFQVLTAPGSTMPHTVSTRSRERTTRNVGIIPPLKNIVTTINRVKLLRSAISLRESA